MLYDCFLQLDLPSYFPRHSHDLSCIDYCIPSSLYINLYNVVRTPPSWNVTALFSVHYDLDEAYLFNAISSLHPSCPFLAPSPRFFDVVHSALLFFQLVHEKPPKLSHSTLLR